MDYLSVNEAEKKWNISARRLQQLCKSGAINGAVKQGRSWLIPEDAELSSKRNERAVSDVCRCLWAFPDILRLSAITIMLIKHS